MLNLFTMINYLKSDLKKLVFLLVISINTYMVYATDMTYKIRSFAASYPIMQSHISNARQDDKGFMWFATWNGLIRYDGRSFYTFKPILCSDGTIFSNRIYNLKNNSAGNFWCVSSDNRLYLFDTEKFKFSDITSSISDIHNKKVKVVTPLKNGITWITFSDFSCIRLDDKTPTKNYIFISQRSKNMLSYNKIYSICKDNMNREWILTDKGAVCFSCNIKIKGEYRYVYNIGNDVLLIQDKGSIAIRRSSGEIHHISITDKKVYYTLQTNGTILLGCENGLYGYNHAKKSIMHYNHNKTKYLYSDSRGRVWAFGDDNMVSLISDVTKETSRNLYTTVAKCKPLKNPQLIYENNFNEIILKPAQGVLSRYNEKKGIIEPCLFTNYNNTYAPEEIKKFLPDYNGDLWVFHTNGTDLISATPKLFSHVKNKSGEETRAMTIDSLGRYWITDRSNSIKLLDKNHNFIGYINANGKLSSEPHPITTMPIYCIKESPQHGIWIGTKGDGLYVLYPQNNNNTEYKIRHYKHSAHNKTSLRSDSIYDIMFRKDEIWLGSYVNGISLGKYHADKLYFHEINNQPSGMKVRQIVDTGNNILLIATSNGLISADISNLGKIRFYINKYRKEEWGLKGNDIMSINKCMGHYYLSVFGSGLSKIESKNLLSNNIHFTNYMMSSSESIDQVNTSISDNQNIWIISGQSVSCFSAKTGNHFAFNDEDFTERIIFSEAYPVIYNKCITVGTTDGYLYFYPYNKPYKKRRESIVVCGIQYQNDMNIYPLNDVDNIKISPDKRSFSLLLSEMEFNEQHTTRIRYKIDNYDQGWNYINTGQPTITYNNLTPGKYSLIIESMNKFGQWNMKSRPVIIDVLPKFTETVWFRMVLFIIAISIILGMSYAIVYFKKMRDFTQKKYSLLLAVDKISNEFKYSDIDKDDSPDNDILFIEKATRFLTDNNSNPNLLIEDFARYMGMSRTAFYNNMKRITGLSPIDFIKQMKIKNAIKLMKDESLSITDIAYKVGFSDSRYFSKCFKAETGMTPTQYREANKKGTS